MPIEGVDGYPLYWPDGWKRTDSWRRSASRYKIANFVRARDGVLASLRRMRVSEKDIVISSNVPLRRDGLPLANIREPDDTGVAVYWMRRWYKDGKSFVEPKVIACDQWKKVWENLWAIVQALEALRTLERCGASQVIERAYAGFAALPPAMRSKPWRQVLDVVDACNVTLDDVEASWRELVKVHHPDKGGSSERVAEINRARDDARKELGG